MGLTHELSNVAEISGVSPADPPAAPRYFSRQREKRLREGRDSSSRDGERRKNTFKSRRQSGLVLGFFFVFKGGVRGKRDGDIN